MIGFWWLAAIVQAAMKKSHESKQFVSQNSGMPLGGGSGAGMAAGQILSNIGGEDAASGGASSVSDLGGFGFGG